MSKFKKSKFKIGDIIRGTIIAMGAGTDRLAEVPCLGIVIQIGRASCRERV